MLFMCTPSCLLHVLCWWKLILSSIIFKFILPVINILILTSQALIKLFSLSVRHIWHHDFEFTMSIVKKRRPVWPLSIMPAWLDYIIWKTRNSVRVFRVLGIRSNLLLQSQIWIWYYRHLYQINLGFRKLICVSYT